MNIEGRGQECHARHCENGHGHWRQCSRREDDMIDAERWSRVPTDAVGVATKSINNYPPVKFKQK